MCHRSIPFTTVPLSAPIISPTEHVVKESIDRTSIELVYTAPGVLSVGLLGLAGVDHATAIVTVAARWPGHAEAMATLKAVDGHAVPELSATRKAG
ncbi:hypothetical protein LCGC14_2340150, partial [marine sediment metagenome]